MGDERKKTPWSYDESADRVESADGEWVADPYSFDMAQAPHVIAAVNAHDALVAELERLEWDGGTWSGDEPYCPSCRNRKEQGHEPGCTLRAALDAARGG